MTAICLVKGQNSALPASEITISVQVAAPVDVSALLVTASGKVRSDNDFVFYNNPTGPGVRLTPGAAGSAASLSISTSAIPAEIAEVRAVITLDDQSATFRHLPAPLAIVADKFGNPLFHFRVEQLTEESVLIAFELYRRDGTWKVRAIGQGYAGGFAELVTAHGIVVDEPPTISPLPTAARPLVRFVPGENLLSLEKRRQLNLRKEAVLDVLTTKGAQDERARIVLVIDKTGSMGALYRMGVIHRVVQRMVPVAIQLDDDGKLEPYLYAKDFASLPPVTIEGAEQWCDTYLHMAGRHGGIDYARIGGVNNEIPIMREIIDTLDPTIDPTLVLFFTDGGFNQKSKIAALLREASCLPIFWQFIGLGAANYGLLRALDTMDGRVVDNAGFFDVDDIDRIADEDLYRRLLGEFPDWLRAARAAGVLRR
ncbi:vWA domain-containing protein [Nocardia higoensis]|uniref:vWA domain-containing protein n=1 Tax=Nocardia higoensis TaxID=228599 RepID=UPI002B4AAE7B|nr:VWA domain-containing protein [Nocardia higoensis]